MKKLLRSIFTISLFLLAFSAFSQDTIVKTDGEMIKAKVLKITDRTVEYQRFGFADGPLYVVSKSEIKEIKYKNGLTDKFVTNLICNRALKLEAFSPLFGNITLAYEQKIYSDIDAEIKVGYIYGASTNSGINGNNFSPQGAFFKAGLKLILPQRFNNMQGFYIKPEFIYSAYSGNIEAYGINSNYNNNIVTINTSTKSTSVGADFVFGYQHVFSGRIVLDSYFGWGLMSTIIKNNNFQNQYFYPNSLPTYGFINMDDNNSGANSRVFTFGILVGYAFK